MAQLLVPKGLLTFPARRTGRVKGHAFEGVTLPNGTRVERSGSRVSWWDGSEHHSLTLWTQAQAVEFFDIMRWRMANLLVSPRR